jgi:hypothetical protein
VQVVIPGITDVDLLIYDPKASEVLALQHKWLVSPDTLKESVSNDERLSKGVEQAAVSRDYLRHNIKFLRAKFELPNEAVIGKIEGVVVSRGAEPTGFLEKSDIPIIQENSFRKLVAQSSDLSSLWKSLCARPDQTRAEEATRDGKLSVNLCGYEFIIPGLAVNLPMNREGSKSHVASRLQE